MHCVLGQEEPTAAMSVFPKLIYKFNTISIKTSHHCFPEARQIDYTVHLEEQPSANH